MRSFASLHLFIRLLTPIYPTIIYGTSCVLIFLAKPCKKSFIHNTDGFILGILTLHSYLVVDLDWYCRIGMLCGIFSYAIMRILAKSQN